MRVEPSPLALKELIESPLAGAILIERKEPSGDPRLIGHHDHRVSTGVEPPHRSGGTGKKPDRVRIAQVADILDQGAVPIQEGGGTTTHETKACSMA
jgi:hypothetical protein